MLRRLVVRPFLGGLHRVVTEGEPRLTAAAAMTRFQPRQSVLSLLLAVTAAAGLWYVWERSSDRRPVFDPAFSRGLALLQAGQFSAAAAAFEAVSHRRPRDAEAAYLLGLARFRAGELRPAAEALRRSV